MTTDRNYARDHVTNPKHLLEVLEYLIGHHQIDARVWEIEAIRFNIGVDHVNARVYQILLEGFVPFDPMTTNPWENALDVAQIMALAGTEIDHRPSACAGGKVAN